MIRRGTVDDLNEMRELGKRFWESSLLEKAGLSLDDESCEDFILNVMAAPKGMVLVAEDVNIFGCILGIIVPWMFNKNISVLTELGWFVTPEGRNNHPWAGVFLFKKLTQWGKREGATVINSFSAIRGESEMVVDFYNNRGLVHMDSIFFGRI